MTLSRVLAVSALALAGPFASLGAQQGNGPDILRGRVTGPDSQPVAGAQVTVRVSGGGEARSTSTNERGAYTMLFPGSAGDYVVTARFVGMTPASVRVVRMGDDAVLIGNLTLADAAVTLEKVTVVARERPRVVRDFERVESRLENDVGGDSFGPPDSRANSLDPARYSILGIDPAENTLTVNGAQVDAVLPTLVGQVRSVSTASADASHGGYSGGRLNAVMMAGGDFHLRYLDASLAPAAFKWVDPASAQVGAESSTLGLTLWTFDPLFSRRIRQNSILTYEQRTSPLPDFPTSPAGLSRLGLAPDSLQRFLTLMRERGVPATTSAVPGSRRDTRLAWLGRVDVGSNANTTFNLMMNVGTEAGEGAHMAPSALPSHGGETRRTTAFATATLSRYIGSGFLTNLATTFNSSTSRAAAYLALPEGRVRIRSLLASGDTAISWLTFGGHPSAAVRTRNSRWEGRGSTEWLSFDSRHKFSLGGEVRADRLSMDPAYNALGSFEFESLEALEAGRAMRFTRESSVDPGQASGLHAGLHANHRWRPHARFSLEYGVRLDADRVESPAAYNPAIDSLFGRRTDVLPRLQSVSPRVGFAWQMGEKGRGNLPALLSMNTGRYQSNLGASTALEASRATGVPSARRLLDCVGDAVPTADWTSFAADPTAIPEGCADGSGGAPVTLAVPTVQLLDRFQPPAEWRTALMWESRGLNAFRVSLVHSRGVAQRSVVDLNLHPTSAFTLPGEANRPVFAPDASVVAATGAVPLAASRREAAYARVLATRSDLRTEATQLAASKSIWITPSLAVFAQYRYLARREQRRGFDAPSAGDPFATTWSRAATPSHTIGARVRFKFGEHALIAQSWMQSGYPYSPLVAGDINGDGATNDLAFIPAPATALGQELTEQLRGAPASARRCVERQGGQLAARNSCTGPWSGGLELEMELSPRWMPDGMSGIRLELANAAGALDRLLHGSARARGWGDSPSVDPTLLVATGFEPTARQFRYQVNPRFGQRGALGAWRNPVELRLRIQMPIGRSLTAQQNRRMADAARATRGDQDAIGRGLVPIGDPFANILHLAEKLQLTAPQTDSLQAMQLRWRAEVDSAVVDLSDYMKQVDDSVPDRVIVERVRATQTRVGATTSSWVNVIRALLTEDQVDRLPRAVKAWIDPEAVR